MDALPVEERTDVPFASTATGEYWGQEVPGLYVFVGGLPEGYDVENAPPHHPPDFVINEREMKLGVRTHAYFVVDYLFAGQ